MSKIYEKLLNNLPSTITYLQIDREYNKMMDNLPSTLQTIKIYKDQECLITKIPSNCKINTTKLSKIKFL